MELVTGRPQDKRIDKEERVYDLLDQLNIDYQRLDHQEANTMEVCLEIEKNLKSTICKNLFLVNSKNVGIFRYYTWFSECFRFNE